MPPFGMRARMQGDLMWLVREGYVTEFIDGRLFAPPAMVEARKKEIEGEEHDPENFPDIPPMAPAAAATAESPAPAPPEETAVASAPPEAEAPAAPVEAAPVESLPEPSPEVPVAPIVENKTEPPPAAGS